MVLVEATIAIRPFESWIHTLHNARLRILDCKLADEATTVHHLFELEAPPESLAQIEKELRHNPLIHSVETARLKAGRLYGAVKAKSCQLCLSIALSPCFVLSAGRSPDGSLEWTLLGSGRAMRELFGRLQRAGVDFRVVRLARFTEKAAVSERQEEILLLALRLGYFDYPKRVRLSELAAMLGIRPPTLAETIRRGQKRVLESYFRLGRRGRP